MNITVEWIWPLLGFSGVALLWWAARHARVEHSTLHKRLGLALRSLALLCLVCALAQPTLHLPAARLSVAYLLDVSRSIDPRSIESALQWIAEATRETAPSHVAYVPFAANARSLQTLEELRSVPIIDYGDYGDHLRASGQHSASTEIPADSYRPIDRSKTDLERAIDYALATTAADHLSHLVVFSDGNETRGIAANAVNRLIRSGTVVHTVPMAPRSLGDAWIDSVSAPDETRRDEPFALEVAVSSQQDTSATLELRTAASVLSRQVVELKTGRNTIPLEASISGLGPVVLEAEIVIDSDPFPGNNRFRSFVRVLPRPRVLYIEGKPGTSHFLKEALEREGIRVDELEPERLPPLDALDRYDAIVLSDVAGTRIDTNRQATLSSYVRDRGGGFILAAGDSVYGEGGYSKTPIEEILPVTFEVKKRDREPTVAMMIVLDKSGSMGGKKIELAKEASKAAVEMLSESHLVGVVAFDNKFYLPVRLQAAKHKEKILQAIGTIAAGGETNIYPALEEAYEQLRRSSTQIKHVILLSDGRSLPNDFQSLVRRMTQAQITVSTIALGTGADQELLRDIATWGTGRDYFIENADRVPQIFTRETEIATGGALVEESFQVSVIKQIEALKGIGFESAPALWGYVATSPKEKAEVLLESGRGDPILARWQPGLGKAIIFTSDLKNRWAVEWLRWPGYGKFWSQIVRDTMGKGDWRFEKGRVLDFRTRGKEGQAHLTLHAHANDGGALDRLRPQIRVIDPNQTSALVELPQTGPGVYELSLPLKRNGDYVFEYIEAEQAEIVSILPYSYPDEYRFREPNRRLLEFLSHETGGVFLPDLEDVIDTRGRTRSRPLRLWPHLVLLALALYLADLFIRRTRPRIPSFLRPLPPQPRNGMTRIFPNWNT